PLVARAVAVHLDPIPVRIREIERFTDQVIALTGRRVTQGKPMAEPAPKIQPRREQNGEVVESRIAPPIARPFARARLFRQEQQGCPRCPKSGGGGVAFQDFKAEGPCVEGERTREIARRERKQTHRRGGMNSGGWRWLWVVGHRGS